MNIYSKAKTIILLATLSVVAMLQVNTVSAEEYQIGAQICQYVTLEQGKTLQYNERGLMNNNKNSQWIICPVATQSIQGSNADIIARVVNKSDEGAEVECVYRLTNELGNIVRAISQKAFVPVGFGVSLLTSNIDYSPGTALSISCKLPSEFMAVSFSIET
jgi:hypothetical protein